MKQPDQSTSVMLKVATVLWVIWGLVHVLAGAMTIGQETPKAVGGIADKVPAEDLELEYHDAVGAIINQHGFNLLWIGAFTTICAIFVWRHSRPAMLLASLVAGVTDIGYFLFMDLGGYVNFIPGTLMTIICAAAALLSIIAFIRLGTPNSNSG